MKEGVNKQQRQRLSASKSFHQESNNEATNLSCKSLRSCRSELGQRNLLHPEAQQRLQEQLDHQFRKELLQVRTITLQALQAAQEQIEHLTEKAKELKEESMRALDNFQQAIHQKNPQAQQLGEMSMICQKLWHICQKSLTDEQAQFKHLKYSLYEDQELLGPWNRQQEYSHPKRKPKEGEQAHRKEIEAIEMELKEVKDRINQTMDEMFEIQDKLFDALFKKSDCSVLKAQFEAKIEQNTKWLNRSDELRNSLASLRKWSQVK